MSLGSVTLTNLSIGVDRALVRYRSRRPDDKAVRARLRELAAVRRRFGGGRLQVRRRIGRNRAPW